MNEFYDGKADFPWWLIPDEQPAKELARPSFLAQARRELEGCTGTFDEALPTVVTGRHRATRNEHGDAWCSRCGERLLLPFSAGYDWDWEAKYDGRYDRAPEPPAGSDPAQDNRDWAASHDVICAECGHFPEMSSAGCACCLSVTKDGAS